MAEVVIDRALFWTRLRKLHRLWLNDKGDKLFRGADALSIVTGQIGDAQLHAKTTCLHNFLLGIPFPDMVVVLCDSSVHFLASKKKIQLLRVLEGEKDLKLHLYERSKEDANKAHHASLLAAIKKSRGGGKVGVVAKDEVEGGAVGVGWKEFVKAKGVEEVDMAAGVSRLFVVKDAKEQEVIKTGAKACAKAMKFFQTQMEAALQKKGPVTHQRLAAKVEDHLSSPDALGLKKDAEVDIAYNPIVMSGGQYDLNITAQSNDEPLKPDVIVASIGIRYEHYCVNVCRTFLVDSTPTMQTQYRALVRAFNKGVGELKPGAKAQDVCNAIKEALKDKVPGLEDKLWKNCGMGMGLEFKEGANVLKAGASHAVEAGMVYNLRVALDGLEDPNAKLKKYSFLVGDMVLVTEQGPVLLTDESERKLNDVTYSFADQEPKAGSKRKADESFPDEGPRRRKPAQDLPAADDPDLVSHQTRLLDKLNQDAKARLLGGGLKRREDASGKDAVRQVSGYSDFSLFPRAAQRNKLFVDMENECVLVPINGVLVPFHISTVKNVTKPEELGQGGQHYTLRLNFVAPPSSEPFVQEIMKQNRVFIKQLSFRSLDPKNFNSVFRDIKELRKRYTTQQAEIKDKMDVVEQPNLVPCRGKPYASLRDLQMRPNMPGVRKTTGTLQAHTNGFRFVTNKGQSLDIMYVNIKHALWQPSKNDLIVLIHFHLKSPIMVGRKKFEDIQFFTEVMDASADLSTARNDSAYDDEHRERVMKKRINEAFHSFCKAVDEKDLLGEGREFDSPFPDLGFSGVGKGRTTSTIMPSVHCLVELIEWPPTVITLSEIEFVSLERVDFAIRNFDMVVVFKDYKAPVVPITSIDKESIDPIKRWLDRIDVKFFEARLNYKWPQLMKHVLTNPQEFFDGEDQGWRFLELSNPDGEEEDEPSEESEEFVAASASESESEFSAVSDEDSVESMGDDEEGKDWDELEEDAEQEDDGYSDDEEEERRGKKKKGKDNQPRPVKDKRR